jgi:hypothetical protein
MTFMIIETYRTGKAAEIYKRFNEKGRMLPVGVRYVNSWITEDLATCYQVMEADSINKIQEWIGHWNDLVHFEIKTVITSSEAINKAKE